VLPPPLAGLEGLIWETFLTATSSNRNYRMAAEQNPFHQRRDLTTFGFDLSDIWEMSVEGRTIEALQCSASLQDVGRCQGSGMVSQGG
jgi:hypothetical protein